MAAVASGELEHRHVYVQPDSPRMRGDGLPGCEKFARRERLRAFRANPDLCLGRDPYSDQQVQRTQWNNGGAAGRML